MADVHHISSNFFGLERLENIIENNTTLVLSDNAQFKIQKCRDYLDEKLKNADVSYYGINTGFGDFKNVVIPQDKIELLQENLLVSHACGMGDEVPNKIVKMMLLLKIQSLSYGHSGVSVEVVQRLIDFYNNDIIPVVFQLGSLGASGDLAPLSHLCLPLLGIGEVYFNGKKQGAADVLQQMNWKPLTLQSKEGLALINGTQFMSAYGTWCLIKAERLMETADLLGALALEAFDSKTTPFYEGIHQIRNQGGQIASAQKVKNYLEGSNIFTRKKEQVQDPYSFRCIPQVHGASRDVISHVKNIFTSEINGVTDNPNIFPDEDMMVSGGNFHGQPLALALDYLAMGLSELGNISERRTYLMLSGQRKLPPFLVKNGGLNSGFMIPQYTAAGMVSQNKQLCTPASVDSVPSSNGQEDHVSMGANAATKCYRVMENLERILAIELMTSAQAFDFRDNIKSSETINGLMKKYRKAVSFIDDDRYINPDMQKSVTFIKEGILEFLDR